MLDRFDLLIEVPEVPINMMIDKTKSESSAMIRQRVIAAQSQAQKRFPDQHGKLNADLTPDEIDITIILNDDARNLLKEAAEKNALTARGYHRVLRVARTIADLDGQSQILKQHLAEALQYRRMAKET